MERQFTASVYIIEQDRVLLIFHRKLNKWLPPGGHMEANETPAEAAYREALEETGYEIEILKEENIWVDHWNAKSFSRPYMCLIEEIPAHGLTPTHQHLDFVYLGKPVGGQAVENLNETHGMKWFTLEEVEALNPDIDIFVETLQVIRKILENKSFVHN